MTAHFVAIYFSFLFFNLRFFKISLFFSEIKLKIDRKLRIIFQKKIRKINLHFSGMSRPEQKRLRKEYTKMFPSGIFGKVKKAFKRAESLDRKTSNSVANQDDNDHHVIPIEK